MERDHRALALVQQMNIEGFAYCAYIGECEAGCSKGIMRAQGPDLAELARTPQLLLRRACAKTRKARAILTATRQSACALDLSQRVRVGLERIASSANSDKSELVAESETCNPHMRLAH